MATTVSTILKDSLVTLGQLRINSATGGTTVTVADSNLGGTDDDFNGGTLIIVRDSAGASAAPEGQFAEVTDYAQSGGTITIATGDAFTASPVSGDVYGVSNGKDYPHYQMLSFIDSAVKEHDIPFVDTTSIDTASSKTEYSYPKAAKRQPPYRVDIQIKTTDSDDNQWREISRGRWEYVPASADTVGLIIFRDQLPASRDIRIWYKGAHSGVWDYGDVIYEGLHPNLVMWQTVLNALLWKNAQQPADENVIVRLRKAEDQVFKMTAEHTIYKPPRRSKLLILDRPGISRNYIATPDPP